MASLLNLLPTSRYSLDGNNLSAVPTPMNTTTPSWGYTDTTVIPDPYSSKLQNTYSVDGNPNERIVDFNRAALGGVSTVKQPSLIDELDPQAPNNTRAGLAGSVVSQIYKSATGRKYRDLGPQPGFY